MQMVKLPFSHAAITLYNAFSGEDEYGKMFTTWHRTVITNCTWGKQNKTVLVGNATLDNNDYLVKIPQDSNYIDGWEWFMLPNSELGGKFTVNTGDVVVRGVVDDEIPYNGSPSGILRKYTGRAFTVMYCHNNTGEDIPLGHYEIGGK